MEITLFAAAAEAASNGEEQTQTSSENGPQNEAQPGLRTVPVDEFTNGMVVRGRLAVICQDEFGDPNITAANDSSDSKPLFARLTSALVLCVASTAGSLA